jgi:predicted anti-sigma-YlaC factor YlaD
MHASDQRLAAYLAGELDPDTAHAIDQHLLDCESCWQAVCAARLGRRAAERLRQPAPTALADRIRLAIDVSTRPTPRHFRRRWAALATAACALVAAAVTAALLVPGHATREDPPVISALVRLAAQPAPAQINPSSVRLGGQDVELQRYPVAGNTVLVATSTRAFPTPADARTPSDAAMAWTITRNTIIMYCPHSQVLLAGPVPTNALITLATRLHLN